MNKKIFAIIGLLTVILVVAVVVFLKIQTTDEFNYANENAPELVDDRDQWSSIQWLTPGDGTRRPGSGGFLLADGKRTQLEM